MWVELVKWVGSRCLTLAHSTKVGQQHLNTLQKKTSVFFATAATHNTSAHENLLVIQVSSENVNFKSLS